MARSTKTKEDTVTEPGEAKDAATTSETNSRAPRLGSKLAKVVDLLESEAGAAIAELMAATGWQQHYADARIMPM